VATEILNEIDAMAEDGWQVHYELRRDDGLDVFVDASCTGAAHAAALGAEEDPETLEYLEDRGRSAAIRYAESALGHRGKVQVTLQVDPLDGTIRHMHDYEIGEST
jgi:hypothetical protein